MMNTDQYFMGVLQYFLRKEVISPFLIGDKVRLKKYDEDVRLLYNREYPNCYLSEEKYKMVIENLANERLGWGEHIVTKIIVGTFASGGWFIYVDNLNQGYHGNIFELVIK